MNKTHAILLLAWASCGAQDAFELKSILAESLYSPVRVENARIEFTSNATFGRLPTVKGIVQGTGSDNWHHLLLKCRIEGKGIDGSNINSSFQVPLPRGYRDSKTQPINGVSTAGFVYTWLPDDKFSMPSKALLTCEILGGEMVGERYGKGKYALAAQAERAAALEEQKGLIQRTERQCAKLRSILGNKKISQLTVNEESALSACKQLGL